MTKPTTTKPTTYHKTNPKPIACNLTYDEACRNGLRVLAEMENLHSLSEALRLCIRETCAAHGILPLGCLKHVGMSLSELFDNNPKGLGRYERFLAHLRETTSAAPGKAAQP